MAAQLAAGLQSDPATFLAEPAWPTAALDDDAEAVRQKVLAKNQLCFFTLIQKNRNLQNVTLSDNFIYFLLLFFYFLHSLITFPEVELNNRITTNFEENTKRRTLGMDTW